MATPKKRIMRKKKQFARPKFPMEDVIFHFQKHKYDKEIILQSKHIQDMDAKWDNLKHRTNSAEVQDQISHMSASFGDLVETQDGLIGELMNRVDEDEIQHRVSISLVTEEIIRYIQNFKQSMLEENAKHKRNVKDMIVKENSPDLMAKYKNIIAKNQFESKLVRKNFQESFAVSKAMADIMHKDKQSEFNSHIEDIEYSTIEMHKSIWRAFEKSVGVELKVVEEKLNDLQVLHSEYVESLWVMKEQKMKIKKLQRITRELKKLEKHCSKALVITPSFIRRNTRLKYEKLANDRLYYLIVASGDAMKRLEEVVKKADKIFLTAKLCSCLETEYERTYANDFLSQFQNTKEISEEFRKFFAKSGQAELEKMALAAEKKALIEENEQLKRKIRQKLQSSATYSWTLFKPERFPN